MGSLDLSMRLGSVATLNAGGGVRRVVAERGMFPGNLATSAGQVVSNGTTELSETSRTIFVIGSGGAKAGSLSLDFANGYNLNSETAGPNDFSFQCAVEIAGVSYPVYFSGIREGTIVSGDRLESDLISALPALAAGTIVAVKCYAHVSSGQVFTMGRRLQNTGSLGEGTNRPGQSGAVAVTGSNQVDTLGLASISTLGAGVVLYSFAPVQILGLQTTPASTVAIIGDSIPSGNGDNGLAPHGVRGWIERQLDTANIAFVNLSRNGDTIARWMSGRTQRMRFLQAAKPSCIISTLATNDLVGAGASTTLAQLQANKIAEWLTMTPVAPVFGATILPRTSADGTTPANALFAVGGMTGIFNDWMRDGAPVDATITAVAAGSSAPGTLRMGDVGHPLMGYFDVSASVEASANSRTWINSGGLATTDGVHPNAIGHVLAAAVSPSVSLPV